MYIKVDIDVSNLREELWSGAQDTLEELTNEEVLEVMNFLEDENEFCDDPLPDIYDLNDFFWHERDEIAKILGYKTFDEIMERNRHNAK